MDRTAGRWTAAFSLLGVVLAVSCTNAAPEATDPAPSPETVTVPEPGPSSEPAVPAPPTRTVESVPADGIGAGVIGFVGCSVTRNGVEGYEAVGGARIWPSTGVSYGGGSVSRWAFGVEARTWHWRDFEAALAANPTTAGVWVQLCTSGVPNDDLDSAEVVLEEIRRRLPDAPIWVSAQPAYTDHVCRIAGADGPSGMQDLAEQLVAGGHALSGPTVGPLTEEQTIDGCHANDAGQRLMGEQLAAFFGPSGVDGAEAVAPQRRRGPGRPGESPT